MISVAQLSWTDVVYFFSALKTSYEEKEVPSLQEETPFVGPPSLERTLQKQIFHPQILQSLWSLKFDQFSQNSTFKGGHQMRCIF